MVREFTCIICPNGCEITAELEKTEDGACRIRSIEGELPLTSVRLTAPIPKARIFDAMEEIRRCRVTAPVKAGTVVIEGLLGYDSDVIVTKTVEKQK